MATIPDLNLPEDVLKLISQFDTLASGVFSNNVRADVPVSDPEALQAGIVGDLASQAMRAPADLSIILGVLEAARHQGLTDDKKYLIEDIIKLAASLPSDSPSLRLLTSKFVDTLWIGLQHPPLSSLGEEYRYRKADGSNNNLTMPHLGQAGSSYARTVQPKTLLSPTLPDPGLLFDELMARGEKTREHPNKVSSMLFYLATIIIHDIFRTNNRDYTKVDNSSYLDLSPLYGNSDESQAQVRTFKDGMLKKDAFYEVRLLGFPPGVAALLISFNRFHNYVAGQLAAINEGNRFDLMHEKALNDYQKAKYKTPEGKRDNDLFQTARLVTCGLYINVVLVDYVRTILNMQTTHSEWVLDPRLDPEKKYGPSGIPEGVGNQVSCEFNLIYRWHSAISARDEQWSIDFFKQNLPGVDPAVATVDDLRMGFVKFLGKELSIDPGARTFGGLERQEDGSFKDGDLVDILSDGIEDVAGAFGARNVPVVMRAIEMLGIEQARAWNVATLNEFRAFFGMIPHKKFSDITSQPEVAQSLETLYGTPDQVELYPGLIAEDAKIPQMPGSGLCPGFTISKAILSDAVALVRGDRFYTVDYNAATLTNWGFTQSQSNPQIAGGGVMYKLLHRVYPGWYRGASAYAFFPFQVPDKTKEVLTELGIVNDYDFTRPYFIPPPQEISTWKAVTAVLDDHARFKVPWGPHTFEMTHHDYMLSGDSPVNRLQHAFVGQALNAPTDAQQQIRHMYQKVTMDLIRERGRQLRTGIQLDVVADLANISHAVATAKIWNIPLKTAAHPVGIITSQEFYTMMSILFAYVFLDVDDASSFALRAGARASSAAIGKIVQAVVWLVQHDYLLKLASWLGKASGMSSDDLVPGFGVKLIQRMSQPDKGVEEVAASIVPTMAAAICTQAQGLGQVMDLLLTPEYYHHWATIRELAKSGNPEDFAKLEKYALECLRLATPAFGVVRTLDADATTIDDGDAKISMKRGDQVLTNFIECGLDPTVFPDPKEIKLDRDPANYIHHGWAVHACLGRPIVTTALATQLGCLARLKNLRRAPGPQGTLKYTMNGVFRVYMKSDWSDAWPFPTTMKIMYDGVEEW